MCTYVLAGSSPVSRTTKPLRNQGFLLFWNPPYANRTPTVLEGLDERLHPICAFSFHRFGHMSVPIQRESGGEVPHVLLEGFHIVTGPKRRNRECVPLGYNNDKTGNPYGTRVLSDSGC